MRANATSGDLCPDPAKRFSDLTATEHTESGQEPSTEPPPGDSAQ